MLRTEVGYAGGTTSAPTYHDLADHAEAVDITYDPSVIPFEQLLELFWASHSPTRARSSQYRSALFCHDETQLALAKASAITQEARHQQKIHTEIVLGKPFYPAEDYHQKWRLRRHPELLADLQKSYETEEALLASTAAAKLNGYLARHGKEAQLHRDIGRLGLSESGQAHLASLTGIAAP